MPRVEMSEKCLACLEGDNFQDRMCPVDCPDGRALQDIFDLCHDFESGTECRHISACKSDPRLCGYWSKRDYPLMQETLNCWSDACEECQWETTCEERGVIN